MDTQRSPKSLDILAFHDPIFMSKNMHFIIMLGDSTVPLIQSLRKHPSGTLLALPALC